MPTIPRFVAALAIACLIGPATASAEAKKVVASKNITQVKAKAGAWVTLGTFAHGKRGSTTLQCRVIKKSFGCQGVSKSGTRAIRVGAIRPSKGRIELAPDSMTLVLEIAGDLAGLGPHPWDS